MGMGDTSREGEKKPAFHSVTKCSHPQLSAKLGTPVCWEPVPGEGFVLVRTSFSAPYCGVMSESETRA